MKQLFSNQKEQAIRKYQKIQKISRKKVERTMKKYNKYGAVDIDLRRNNHRRKALTENDKTNIKAITQKQKQNTIRVLFNKAVEKLNIQCSMSTFYKHMKQSGKFMKPDSYYSLTQTQKEEIIRFCNQHLRTKIQFNNLVFVDESTFYLNRNRKKVYALKGQKIPHKINYNPDYSVMIIGGICSKGKVIVEMMEERLNSVKQISFLEKFIKQVQSGNRYFAFDFQRDQTTQTTFNTQ